ncbi:MAG: hypothetical protein K8W52_00810 [Deltaproteobacteria bacterium]|nr:hypothetical protein [Deltaproteobacteria bacterium]
MRISTELALAALALAACKETSATDPDAPAIDATAVVDASTPDASPDATVASDARPDAGPGTPDIVLVESEMVNTWTVSSEFFGADSCELIEGCIGAQGNRRLLRFDTVTANMGTADLVMGPVPPAGVSTDVYVWSECHHHHHVTGYADYQLLGPGGVVASGHKQAFCLEDIERLSATAADNPRFTCDSQGIQAGWADVYNGGLPCQWIDVTGVPPGQYTLKIAVNPSQQIVESNYDNDTLLIDVVL